MSMMSMSNKGYHSEAVSLYISASEHDGTSKVNSSRGLVVALWHTNTPYGDMEKSTYKWVVFEDGTGAPLFEDDEYQFHPDYRVFWEEDYGEDFGEAKAFLNGVEDEEDADRLCAIRRILFNSPAGYEIPFWVVNKIFCGVDDDVVINQMATSDGYYLQVVVGKDKYVLVEM